MRKRVGPGGQQFGEGGDLLGLGQSSGAAVGAGEPPGSWLEDDRAATTQGRDVLTRRRMLPHLGVHGRGEQHRAASSQQGRGQ